jgi:hypothetical protein
MELERLQRRQTARRYREMDKDMSAIAVFTMKHAVKIV